MASDRVEELSESQHGPNCPFCRSKESSPLYETYTNDGRAYDLRECSRCGAAYLSPFPTAEELDAAYSQDYYGGDTEKFSSPVEWALDKFRRLRARRVARYLKADATVLDIGCGNGRFLSFLGERGFEIHGIELPGKAFERARRIPGLCLKEGELAASDYPSEFFDLITMWHVLEHVTKPKETLETIAAIVKPGGFVGVSLPNIQSYQSRVFRGHWFHLDPPRHVFFMGPRELKEIFRGLGFELISESHFSLEHNVFGVVQSVLNASLDGRDQFFDRLKGSGSGLSSHPSRIRAIFWITLGGILIPGALAFSIIEAAGRRGGTMEFVFQKVSEER